MIASLDTAPVRSYNENMTNGRAAIERALREAPGSIRELAAEASVSDYLLRAIRDGDRRLTPEVRAAVVAALRRWSEQTGDLADALDAADLEPGGSDE